MALNSYSSTSVANPDLRADEPKRSGGNKKWLAEVGDGDGVILIGGTSLADFRVRVAQSSLRGDMLPSFWSQAGILLGGGMFASVPLDLAPRATAPARRPHDDVSSARRIHHLDVIGLYGAHRDRRDPHKRTNSRQQDGAA